MSEEQGHARPRQVTMAVVMAVVSSVVLILGLFDTLDRLRTPDMREVVGEFLAEPPGSSLGIDTAQVVELMRALAFVSGALAAAALVFAIFVLQRHRGARIGFTVVAALLLLTVPVAGLMPFFLAVAAFLLWSQPARDWYAGRAPAPARGGAGRPTHGQGPTAPDPGRPLGEDRSTEQPVSRPASGDAPPPYAHPFAEPAGPPQSQPPAAPYPPAQPRAYGSSVVPSPREPGKRPLTVTLAAVLTWVGAGLTALMMVAFVAILSAGSDAFVEEFERAARESQVTLDPDQVLALGWAVAGTFLVWSLISMVLAFLTLRRSNAARIALAVSAVIAALLSLVSILSLVSLVTLVLAGAAAIMLFTGGANQWFARRSEHAGHDQVPYPPAYPPAYPYAPPPAPPAAPAAAPAAAPPAAPAYAPPAAPAYAPPNPEDRVEEQPPAGQQPSGEQPPAQQPPPQPQYQQPPKRNQPW